MIKIAFSGKANSGKNTTAEMFASELKLLRSEYVVAAFADKIKEITQLFFPGCDPECLYGDSHLREKKIQSDLSNILELNVSYRDSCVNIGKIGREYNENFWIAHLENFYKKTNKNIKCFMVSDQRFINELKWLKSEGFISVRVKRKNINLINDISEIQQDLVPDSEYDFIIENDGTLVELREKVSKIITQIR